MVKIMENPWNHPIKMDDLGYFTPYFWKQPKDLIGFPSYPLPLDTPGPLRTL